MAEHFCSKHHTKFFKTPKMKRYAHPVEDEYDDNGKQLWCNEPEGQASEPKEIDYKKPAYGQDSPEKRASIEGQKAAEIVASLVIAGKLSENEPLARSLFKWCKDRLPEVAQSVPSTPSTSQPVAQKAPAGSGQPPKTDDDLFGEKVETEVLLAEALKCDTGGKLGYFAQQHGIDLKAFVAKVSCAPSQLKTMEQIQAAARVLFGK